MAHKRTAIRAALVALLKGTGPSWATVAGANVFANRLNNIQIDNLPAIVVRDGDESSTDRDISGRVQTRDWDAEIELRVSANTGYDSALDSFADQVEDLIAANRQLSGTATLATYQGAEVAFDNSGEKPVALLTLTYRIRYLI